MNRTKSDFLFATPSLVSGAARLLDMYGLFDSYNSSSTEREADRRAALADWLVVGQDINAAIRQFERMLPADNRTREICGDEEQMSLFR